MQIAAGIITAFGSVGLRQHMLAIPIVLILFGDRLSRIHGDDVIGVCGVFVDLRQHIPRCGVSHRRMATRSDVLELLLQSLALQAGSGIVVTFGHGKVVDLQSHGGDTSVGLNEINAVTLAQRRSHKFYGFLSRNTFVAFEGDLFVLESLFDHDGLADQLSVRLKNLLERILSEFQLNGLFTRVGGLKRREKTDKNEK